MRRILLLLLLWLIPSLSLAVPAPPIGGLVVNGCGTAITDTIGSVAMLEIDQNTGRVCTSFAAGAQAVNLTQWGSVNVTAAAALSDSFANPTAPPIGAFNLDWDPANTQWERVRAPGANTPINNALGIQAAQLWAWDSGTPTRVQALWLAPSNADAQNLSNPNFLWTMTIPELFNGTTADKQRSAAGTVGIPAVNIEGTKTTYRLAGLVTPAATPADVIQIQGSGTKTVRFSRIAISVASTAAGIADVVLRRESSVITGGTCVAQTIGKNDTNNAVATAANLVCTANPAGGGALVSNLGAKKSVGTTTPVLEWSLGQNNGQELVLRGTSDFLSVNGNGDTLLAGEVWSYDIEWTEE